MEIDRNIEPQTRWQGNENSPIAIVLNHYPRDNGRDDFTEQEGWPDPTAVTNLNLRFLLYEAAGLWVPPVPTTDQRAACTDAEGYGKDGILYFTNAITHTVAPKDSHNSEHKAEGAKRLIRNGIIRKEVVVAAGDLACEVICDALGLEYQNYDSQRIWTLPDGKGRLFHVRQPSYSVPIEEHWYRWKEVGDYVQKELHRWYADSYVPWKKMQCSNHPSYHNTKEPRSVGH